MRVAEAADAAHGIGRKDIEQILSRFRALNRQRLNRIHQGVQAWQRIVVELLPLLYHVNHPLLPGFVHSDAPCGIAGYLPDNQALRAARSLSKGFTWKKRAYRRFPLNGLYLMGSIGSIGQSHGSDLDVWLCHQPELGHEQLALLREKATAIENWAGGLGLEMHTFLIDPSRFRHGQRDALSNESSGSTQPLLLLEEFYRSAVWLAGHYPLWWLVAPQHEQDYAGYTQWLIERRFIQPGDWLDLGGLEEISAAEFFGAAQWQLYKGIASPYKSVLKLLLIEAFADDFPRVEWLAQGIKRALWNDETDADALDPYLQMYRRIEHYLASEPNRARLDLIRRCLYIKADVKLSESGEPRDWRGQAWRRLCDEWGWRDSEIRHIDAHREWKADRVQHEMRQLVAELTRSYRLLQHFAASQGAAELCETAEFNLLGKKLRTAFEQRPGKIERLNPNISADLSEPRLSLRRTADGDAWLLYRDPPEAEDMPPGSPLKAAPRILELLLWCRANHLVTASTQLDLGDDESEIDADEARAILASLARMRFIDAGGAEIEALARPPRIEGCALLINTGRDPLARLTERGLQLTSNRADPLSFGAARDNLVLDIDCIQHNSWGELQVAHHEGHEGLLDLLCEYLRSRQPECRAVAAWSHSSPRGGQIAKRVAELFEQLGDRDEACWRHVVRIGAMPCVIQADNGRYRWQCHASEEELLDALQIPLRQSCITRFDSEYGNDTPLAYIFSRHQAERLQLFYQQHGDAFEYWLLDEYGALFHHLQQDAGEQHFVTHQRRFLDNLMLRRQLATGRTRLDLAPSIHKLWYKRGDWRIQRCDIMAENLCVDFLPLELLSANDENRHLQLLFDQHIFDSIVLGDDFYPSVARAVLAARRHAEPYPIYLTGVVNNQVNEVADTIPLMHQKIRIERRLNQAVGA